MASLKPVSPGSDTLPDQPDEDGARAARDRLLQKIQAQTDLPALGSSVSRVVQVASSDGEAVRHLAHFILSDVALTQKILRVANTTSYRTASGAPVTTISKAIFLLGFDTVKTNALAMLLVDGMSGRHAKSVRAELTRAFAASIAGREVARRSQFKDPEEAAVAALFKNIGRLLLASHEHKLYVRINQLLNDGTHTPAKASMEVLGCSLDSLGEAVLGEWKIPEPIIHALAPLPSGIVKPAANRQEWMRQVAAFSAAAAALISDLGQDIDPVAKKGLLLRFGAALNLDHASLDRMLSVMVQEARTLTEQAQLGQCGDEEMETSGPDSGSTGLPNELLLNVFSSDHLQSGLRHASGKPLNARDLLLAGVQDVSQMLASGSYNINDLLLLVLETLYSSMGFRFGAVCLRDVAASQFRARIVMGEKSSTRQGGFMFPCAAGQDLFHLALQNDADLMIADASLPKIRSLIPSWHCDLLPDACSFIVLPLVLHKKPIGLFYADRDCPAPEGVPADETALVKTLKGQVLTALQGR